MIPTAWARGLLEQRSNAKKRLVRRLGIYSSLIIQFHSEDLVLAQLSQTFIQLGGGLMIIECVARCYTVTNLLIRSFI